jgi:hypothetical protein
MFSINRSAAALFIGAAFTSAAFAGNVPVVSTGLFDQAAAMVKSGQTMSSADIASGLGSASQGSSHGTQTTFPSGTYMGVSVTQIRVSTNQSGVPQFIEIVTDPSNCIDAGALQKRYTADGLYDVPDAPADQPQRYLTHEADGVRIAIGIPMDPALFCAKSFIAEIVAKPSKR